MISHQMPVDDWNGYFITLRNKGAGEGKAADYGVGSVMVIVD